MVPTHVSPRARLGGALLLLGAVTLGGCAALEDLSAVLGPELSDPTTAEMIAGLEQALSKGTAEAVAGLARDGGYLQDASVRIRFPDEAAFAADALRKVGLGGLVESFEKRLNEGAEAGAQRALPIFEDAIGRMTFADAKGILFGGEHAATDYFRGATYDSLVAEFSPEIHKALGEVGATALWSDVTSKYNAIPFTSRKIDTDLVHYTTARALDGLFLKLAEEEARIRADPVARTTALLERVFGYAARQLEQR